MKEKSARQDTNPTELIRHAKAIWRFVEEITEEALHVDFSGFLYGAQKAHEFFQRLCRIAYFIARFMVEQLKKEQH